jgi:hypothetical protein
MDILILLTPRSEAKEGVEAEVMRHTTLCIFRLLKFPCTIIRLVKVGLRDGNAIESEQGTLAGSGLL